MRQSPRIRRLHADWLGVRQLAEESSIFSFQANGSLPELYRFIYRGPGTWKTPRETVGLRDHHEVLVTLGAAYPRMMPQVNWQTPVFHPNISANGIVCLGGYGIYWVPSLRLEDLAIMLWDMIRYANCDVQSPYNREAALWAKSQKDFEFPLDRRPLRDLVSTGIAPGPGTRKPPVVVALPPAAGIGSATERLATPPGARGGRSDDIHFVGAAAAEDQDILFLD